jgi:hypothetical protein
LADPFFELIADGEGNACVGKQGDALNYVEGYVEAAQLLVAAVLDGRLYGSRDTLAMPILYNARHGLELSLKFVLDTLVRIEMARPRARVNHDIKAYWTHIRDAHVGDRTVRKLIEKLEPFVTSLAQIDQDGQELRYPEKLGGGRSLEQLAVVNLPHVRGSLDDMAAILDNLTDRCCMLVEERPTGSFTPESSREDLRAIAAALGNEGEWNDPGFDGRKAQVMDAFELSGKAFSRAIEAIRGSRALGAIVGRESSLSYLGDDQVEAVATLWREANREESAAEAAEGEFRIASLKAIMAEDHSSRKLTEAVMAMFSLEQFADLATLYEIGRHNVFGEYYEAMVASEIERLKRLNDRFEATHHILTKRNFLDGLVRGLAIVGRPSLAARLTASGAAAAS